MKNVTVIYFAQLGQQRGLTEESIQTDLANISELYQHLQKQHNFSLGYSHIRAARNEEFCSAQSCIEDGDTIAFMPPVSGG